MSSSSSSFHPSATPPVPHGYADRGPDLPKDYGVTRLAILPRDPQWMHAYWEVAPYTWDEAERNFGQDVRSGRAVLRLYSTNPTTKKAFDIPVHLDARNWYIFSPHRGGKWYGELGLLLPDGRFVLLAISNEIQLPVGQVSELMDEKWGILKAEWERLYQLSGGGRLGAGSLDVAKMLAQRWELLRQVSSWFGPPGASWSGLPTSASWARPRESFKDFWLQADCELIVYGATEPDARVKLQGQDIALNPDGTFSFRFALPDGQLDIPIEATNRDGDMTKSVAFTVTRATKK